jgi:hypothetical protein
MYFTVFDSWSKLFPHDVCLLVSLNFSFPLPDEVSHTSQVECAQAYGADVKHQAILPFFSWKRLGNTVAHTVTQLFVPEILLFTPLNRE